MAWRFKIVVLYVTLFIIGILLVEELITYSVKLPNYGYQKVKRIPDTDDRKSLQHLENRRPYKRHKTTVDISQIAGGNGPVRTVANLEIHQNTYRKTVGWNSNRGLSHSEVTTAQSAVDTERDHAQRIENLYATCEKEEHKRRFEQRKANLTHFYYNKDLKFAYCKVPKSGSTFWMKVFMIMSRGKNYSNVMSSMSRREIHDRSSRMVANPLHILRHNIPTIVVSRNPFSRLFSAYIDKVFLPLFWENFKNMPSANVLKPFIVNMTTEVLKSTKKPLSGRLVKYREHLREKGMLQTKIVRRLITPICMNNASFEDFLKFIIAEVQAGNALEPHWAPISHLCHPCRFNILKIVKQESFSSDVEHALGSLNIDLDEYDWLKSSLHENRVQNSAPGIVSVVDFKLKLHSIKTCISPKETIRRLWKAFQIQGFISSDVEIPETITKNNTFINQDVTDAVLEAVNLKPLTQSESQKQRHKYFTEAFRGISDETLYAIQQIYYLDFVLFGYSFNPP